MKNICNCEDLKRIKVEADIVIIAFKMSHLCILLSHRVRTTEPLSADTIPLIRLIPFLPYT